MPRMARHLWEASVLSSTPSISISCCFGKLHRERALLKTSSASCQTGFPCSPPPISPPQPICSRDCGFGDQGIVGWWRCAGAWAWEPSWKAEETSGSIPDPCGYTLFSWAPVKRERRPDLLKEEAQRTLHRCSAVSVYSAMCAMEWLLREQFQLTLTH